jgi:hypothetical protein
VVVALIAVVAVVYTSKGMKRKHKQKMYIRVMVLTGQRTLYIHVEKKATTK